ncbi:major facilitator superfamily domain-containing protein [Mycena albidolilacea]|uniref:Major facilitator superfamily domain-containing protein n=1 Tax=Mycena albidolilacea TaxID=1033008 RepID=A0AAD6YWB3_9AGAR|nr:major facilitator superfamily domain-containing protein [Mycena albidolilacea]
MLGQCFNLTPFGATMYARWLIADGLGVPGDNGQMSWVAAGFSITTGSFVLVGGRLGDVYGHRLIWLLALVWSMIWNLVSGFARSCRFMTRPWSCGDRAGLMLPTAVALLGQAYPPGRKRNLAFGLFGALAPFSGAGGSVLEVLLAQLVSPRWIWWLHAIKNAMNLAIAIPGIPTTIGVGLGGDVDWLGAFLGVAGLILFNFSFNQAPLAGWASSSVIAPLVIDTVTLLLFAVWEIKGAKSPILPFSIWRAPTFLAVMITFNLSTTSEGQARFRVAWLAPFTIDGFIAACLAAVLISRVPAQVIICGALIAVMLPSSPRCFASFGPDMTFTAAQLVASNTVRRSEQGVAGSLVGTAFNYGYALGIGLGGTVEAHTNAGGTEPLRGLRGALYLGCGMAVLGILIVVLFVRVPKDNREGYDDEREVEKIAV